MEVAIAQLPALFVKLNRNLVSADTPQQWQPAAQAMDEFLDVIAGCLERSKLPDLPLPSAAKLFSILLTVMAEAGQYRHEQFIPASLEDAKRREMIDREMLPAMNRLRQKAIRLAKQYLSDPAFASLQDDLLYELFPLLDSMDAAIAPDKFMPFRVIQIGNVAERLYSFRLRTDNPYLTGNGSQVGLFQEIYNHKYLRFGTSGVRGRWQVDFTERRARQVVQAICDFLNGENIPAYVGAENLRGRKIIVGYDSRRNARLVAEWLAQVCLANGFRVDLANRDTPTPALVYYLADYLDKDEVAGLINCTASHNPPEWQGIKFNPRLGFPAPSNLTDFIAFRINELQLLDEAARVADLAEAEQRGTLRGFDPISLYADWVMNSGNGNQRIALDWEGMRQYYTDKLVVVDEMHGAGRGYLTKLLGAIGIRHTVLHAERDPDIPGLDYANPEEPFIDALKTAVRSTGAKIGVGMDTDSDRFGIIDQDGTYYRPNQILPMLIRYLGVERQLTGRVIATQTGSPLIEVIASHIPGNEANKPNPSAIPPYVRHPFYRPRRGKLEDRAQKHSFLVPVGIKYIEEIRRVDASYKGLKPLPDHWRNNILLGGEESSGLTTRGHVTDKDGIWADLLVLDMLAYYGRRSAGKINSIGDIWRDTVNSPGCWVSYGGRETGDSNSGRTDLDAILEAKEGLIDYFLDYLNDAPDPDSKTFAGMEIVALGGIRYDIAEIQLRDEKGDARHYLRVRASGTEPINRVYVESSDPRIARTLMQTALDILEQQSIHQVEQARSAWRLVDIMAQTQHSPRLEQAVLKAVRRNGWQVNEVLALLKRSLHTLEQRTQKVAAKWMTALTTT